MGGHYQTGGIRSAQGGSFLFPITPVFNSSLQYSHNQSISLISKPQDQGTIILSLSLNTFSCHIRSCTHTTHTHPQQASQLQRIQQRSSTIYNPTIFSINHRSAPWLVTTPIIDLGLDSLVDISCIQVYTSTKHLHLHLGGTYYARVSEDLLIENETTHASSLNRSIACGGEFKVTLR